MEGKKDARVYRIRLKVTISALLNFRLSSILCHFSGISIPPYDSHFLEARPGAGLGDAKQINHQPVLQDPGASMEQEAETSVKTRTVC